MSLFFKLPNFGEGKNKERTLFSLHGSPVTNDSPKKDTQHDLLRMKR
jgi:hypothetical protein